jgi:hypothetical protein
MFPNVYHLVYSSADAAAASPPPAALFAFFCAFLLSVFLPLGCDLDDFLSSCSNIFNNFFFFH